MYAALQGLSSTLPCTHLDSPYCANLRHWPSRERRRNLHGGRYEGYKGYKDANLHGGRYTGYTGYKGANLHGGLMCRTVEAVARSNVPLSYQMLSNVPDDVAILRVFLTCEMVAAVPTRGLCGDYTGTQTCPSSHGAPVWGCGGLPLKARRLYTKDGVLRLSSEILETLRRWSVRTEEGISPEERELAKKV